MSGRPLWAFKTASRRRAVFNAHKGLPILGDPGAVTGDGEKSKIRAKKSQEREEEPLGTMVVYHLPKNSGNFGWDVNGKTVLVCPNGNFPK